MFSNLNGVGPSFGLSVSSSTGQWSEMGLGSPLRREAGSKSSHCWDMKKWSILLQEAFCLKLVQVNVVCCKGTSKRLKSDTHSLNLFIWVEKSVFHFYPTNKEPHWSLHPHTKLHQPDYLCHYALSRLHPFRYSMKDHKCRISTMTVPNAIEKFDRGK